MGEPNDGAPWGLALVCGRAGIRLRVLVQPRASKDAVVGLHDGRIKVAIRAAPVDGAANAAVVALLAKVCGVPVRAVEVASGEGSRRKTVVVEGDPPALEAAVTSALARVATVG